MKKIIYSYFFCKILGWKVVGGIDENIKKCIVIAVPHTSWWDFFLGIFSRGILDIEINFLAKKELFIFPFKLFFKWVGGAPLNRGKKENKVDAIVKIFREKEIFRLALAPEGTREKVAEWKTGFYYMALKANIPIVPVAFDYGKKEVVYNNPFYPTGNIEADFKVLQSYYIGVIGKIPENSFIPK